MCQYYSHQSYIIRVEAGAVVPDEVCEWRRPDLHILTSRSEDIPFGIFDRTVEPHKLSAT